MTAAAQLRQRELPQDLPRLVMRRAVMAAAGVLAVAMALGLVVVDDDIQEEVDAGMHLAESMAVLAQAQSLPADAAMQRLRSLRQQGPLRHLGLEILDAEGHVLLSRHDSQAGGWQGWLLRMHERWLSRSDERIREWTLQRSEGAPWRVRLSASPEGERREALANLLGMLVLLLGCIVGLLLTMNWTLHRSFRPLSRLVHAIDGIGRGDGQALEALPRMPVRELEVMAAATRHLGDSLQRAQAQRRALSQKMLTLQENERARLAHELHDELGQRLTGMRVQAARLLREHGQGGVQRCDLLNLQAACEEVQREVRTLLVGLQPFGHPAGADGQESVARLVSLLRTLVKRWNDPQFGAKHRTELQLRCRDAEGRPREWPQGSDAPELLIPQPMAQVLYRISQESLTNVARHASADAATILLDMTLTDAGVVAAIEWTALDDGIGIDEVAAAMRRGNGLAGINQRIWAVGSNLDVTPAEIGNARPGLRLSAHFAPESVTRLGELWSVPTLPQHGTP